VPTFHHSLLDSNGSIIGAEFLESADLNAAIVEAYDNCRKFGTRQAAGFEIWQDTTLLHKGSYESAVTSSFR